jgi:hypothetical protein
MHLWARRAAKIAGEIKLAVDRNWRIHQVIVDETEYQILEYSLKKTGGSFVAWHGNTLSLLERKRLIPDDGEPRTSVRCLWLDGRIPILSPKTHQKLKRRRRLMFLRQTIQIKKNELETKRVWDEFEQASLDEWYRRDAREVARAIRIKQSSDMERLNLYACTGFI